MRLSRLFYASAILLLVSGCLTTPKNFEMYPSPVSSQTVLQPDQAVILVGTVGGGIDYLQLGHSSMPAINLKHPFGVGIVAIPVPVGLKEVQVITYVPGGQGSGYVGGRGFGYINVKTPPVDINGPGIYYLGTIYPYEQRAVREPVASQLAAVRERYKSVFEGRQPVNFKWP